jgi:hypothetical protein
MKHTLSGQALLKIAENGLFHAVEGRSFTARGVSLGFGTSTCLRDGKIMASGGGYGKYRLRYQTSGSLMS